MKPVTCPFCGKENPESAEVCQYCQARLKPLDRAPQNEPESQKPAPVEKLQQPEGKDNADWLADLRSSDTQDPSAKPISDQPPDWLRGFRDQVHTEEFRSDPQPLGDDGIQESGQSGSETPPWLEELRSQALEYPGGSGSEPGEISTGVQFDPTASNMDPEFDDSTGSGMLKRIDGIEWHDEPSSEDETETGEELFELSATPFGVNSDRPAPGDSARINLEDEKDMYPSWLEEMPASTVKEPDTGKEEESAKTELPSWLEMMRPVEVEGLTIELPEEIRSHMESVGPLAGLPGILPAEPEISISRKPAVYAMKLQVSESQQNQAAIFDQTIKSENEAPQVTDQVQAPANQILRVIFAVILLLGILAPVFSFYPPVQLPPLIPEEVLVVSQIVSGLPPGSPVLIAVEFEPGYSGEMDAALGAVMDHLMLQQAFLAFISTTGTGPVQAEHLVEVVNQTGSHQYSSSGTPANYINLGFLSGGKAGLREFAQNPQEVIFSGVAGNQAPESTPLAGFSSLDQFSLVIVATENFTKARDWIEQVQPLLGDTPMVFVNSTQSEPTIQPYYHAQPQQVKGMVSGLIGGVYYGNSIGRSGIAQRCWPSFNSGLFVALALVVLGGGMKAIKVMTTNLRKRDSGRKET